ncbi:GNAT family N-acetyltransferase [Brachyspira alvinipulli]|uniref:GNAT family N-acetyltransferase n=1 Tax=Brachyspira alvinipulli TaxID=84379 RepID=UPI0030066E1D
MYIYELNKRDDDSIDKLYIVWEKSVRASHLFLTENDIINISKHVKQALIVIKHLIVVSINNEFIGFMGIDDRKLEMLFLDPDAVGNGIGRKLIEYGISNYNINEVSVNEQNINAYGFYEHMGFRVYNRSEYDELGNNFPILYMKLL